MITLTADNGKILNRVPVKVSIKRDSEEIGTYYGLSGYGWVVNLGPGNYFAIFSIPNANVAGKTISINISSGTSFMDLDYIINKKYLDNSTIYLDTDYAYENTTVFNGIVIDRNLTLDGKGHKIDGKNLARIFYVTSDAAVTFNNITFINGHAEGSQYGGAILAESEDKVKATHCEFRDNIAYRGGAVCRVDCYKCYFVSNKADNGKEYAYGGAIYSGDAVNCTFMSNEAKYGGAIYDGDAVNSEFRGNKAMFGGAISGCYAINCIFESNDASSSGGAIYQGNAEDCHFEHNTAVNDGGAIYRGNATGSYFDRNVAHMGGAISDCDATDCTFKRNTANAGGAIYGRTAENCTFENNSANETGGAIYCGMAINSIFSDNSAKQMGGAIYDGSAYDSTFTGNKANYDGGAIYNGNAINCIFTNNTADHNGGAICKGNVVSPTFTANYAGMEGGAIHGDKANNQYSTAVDCIFNNNTAEYNGGAMAYGNATNCSFTGNDVNIGNGTAMYGKGEYPCNALNCVFTNNNADKQVIRYGIADSCIFNGDTPGSDVVVLKPVLSVSNFISTYNDGSVLVVNVTSASGMPIANARIKVDVYTITGTFVGTYIISSSGWKVPLNAGNYIATFNATDYGSDTVQGIIVVNKDKTAVTSGAVSTVYNKDKYLVITLKDSKGNALSGESVTVTLGSEKTYKTDKNGQIRINVGKVVPKTYNAKISFAGSTNYLASSTTAKVVVKKASPKLTAKAKTFKKKVKIKKYTITLKNNVGKAIKKVRVTIKIKKKTYTAKTNAKGKATFKIKKLTKKGTYKATVAFKGNAYYNKVTKKVKIKIK